MVLIVIFLRAFIIAPIRALFDLLKWLWSTVFPFLGTLLGSTPLNIIFIVSIVIMFLMWRYPDVVVWLMVLGWEILASFFYNIYLAGWNIINTLFYNWFTPLYNEIADFVVLVWTMVNNGICNGMPPFADPETVDCYGFGDWLTIIEIWISSTYEYITIAMAFLAMLAQLLFTILGNLDTFTEFSLTEKYCPMPACSDWGEMRIDPDTGNIIKYPGLAGINYKDNLDEADVRVAQIIAAIIIFFIQWFTSEWLPFLVQISAFLADVGRLLIYYYQEFLILLTELFANILGAAFYIIARAYQNILTQPDKTIVFDPDFWNTNITAYTKEKQQEILDAYVYKYMVNITELLLNKEDLPGREEVRQELLRYYGFIHIALQILNELPFIMGAMADKVWCLFLYLFQCLNLSFFCSYLFKPGEACIGLQKIATNDYLQSQTPDPWYYNYKDPDLFRFSFLAGCSNYGCNQTYCPSSAPSDCQLAAANLFVCIPSVGQEITQLNFACIEAIGTADPRTGPLYDHEDARCIYENNFGSLTTIPCPITPYEPFYHSPISIPVSEFGGKVGVNFTYPFDEGCNITDVPGFNDSCRYCGFLFVTEASGIFYFSREFFVAAGLEFLYVALDEISDLLGINMWAALTELSFYLSDLCIELNELVRGSGACPCCKCQPEDGSILKFFDDVLFRFFTCEGYPCIPILNPPCCTPDIGNGPEGYYSLLYIIRDIIETFDLFNVLDNLF